jgi:hypothetical protein
MKTAVSFCFGFALAAMGYGLASAPAAAAQAPALVSTAPGSGIVLVEEHGRMRCERVRRECRERHHMHGREYRECVRRDHCEP